MDMTPSRRWLLLALKMPPGSPYLRVKFWRRLREFGAVTFKNSLYILPMSPASRDCFRRLIRELERHGGEGALCEANFVEGMADEDVEMLFRAASDAEYRDLARRLRPLTQVRASRVTNLKLKLEKIAGEYHEILARDFFGAAGRDKVEQLLSELEHSPITRPQGAFAGKRPVPSLRGKTWVTRKNIHVDRIACAWLIRRFIDDAARFDFVSDRRHRKAPGRLGFDMAQAEFTHEGDKCSFEVLAEHVAPKDAALMALAGIIHDLDLKDGKFGRPETAQIGEAIDSLCAAAADDMDRIARGAILFDEHYAQLRKMARSKA
jgi:hypothetical protein